MNPTKNITRYAVSHEHSEVYIYAGQGKWMKNNDWLEGGQTIDTENLPEDAIKYKFTTNEDFFHNTGDVLFL